MTSETLRSSLPGYYVGKTKESSKHKKERNVAGVLCDDCLRKVMDVMT